LQLSSITHEYDREGLSFFRAALHLFRNGGASAFFKGMLITGFRDMIFGCTYEVGSLGLKHLLHEDYFGSSTSFFANLIAGALATVASGPANYVRTMKYTTSPNEAAPSAGKILKELWIQTREKPNFFERLGNIQHRMKIGWGTMRVGCGMAVGQKLFDETKAYLELQRAESRR